MSSQQIVTFVNGKATISYRNALINGWIIGIVDWSTLRAVCSK